MEKPLRFSQSARKHRIGKASARYVLAHSSAAESRDPATGALARSWVGVDERGRELEIEAVEKPDCWLVFHVMPTNYRRKHR